MPSVTVSLPDDLRSFIDSQIATGRFADEGDYLRDLVRERQGAVDRLRALIEEGDASGPGTRTIEEVIAGARERFEPSIG